MENLNCLDMALKIGFSIILNELFLKVVDLENGNYLRDAYFLAVLSS